ncbi:RNA polymerase sigma factor [Acidipila rosea]|uniref:RNA polymerase sigma-70 factor (ECF subfamily) n=1 Tax=Acidipila rosea TaxID=768535 RepID=A0A4R1LA83_9BACT|nr:RNA polymerase sigma factor [Acidipila rosea]MBW4027167.1 RNA polymerase sigma factor [Acidobacteriota bacterium]MBW4045744.1 RNA polymerase sigma factor [Acidobacteriota bacterium]TCK74327.1 RNA polymerase sigma-70 factor (ECF subfamily) [Acidipila rosea]
MSAFEGQAGGWLYAASAASVDTDEIIASLAAEYSTALYRVAYSVTRNAAEAEDAVQETFLRVLRHQAKLGEIRDARVWLVRITWNIVLDRKRRSKSRPETDDLTYVARTLAADAPGADQELVHSEAHARILRLVDELPRKEREALLLTAVEELSTAQVAAVLRTTESSVRSRIFRARKQLSALLNREGISR